MVYCKVRNLHKLVKLNDLEAVYLGIPVRRFIFRHTFWQEKK